MGRNPTDVSDLPDYLQFPDPGSARNLQVGASYAALTGRTTHGKVHAFICTITRLHGDDAERLLREVHAVVGADDLLRIVRATPRGGTPVIPDRPPSQRRHSGRGAPEGEGADGAATPPYRSDESRPTDSHETTKPGSTAAPTHSQQPDGRHARTEPPPAPGESGQQTPPSEWFDGTEDWPVTPPMLDADGRIKGVIYTPKTHPSFDPTSSQRWDRRHWEKAAAQHAAVGDFTVHATLTLWELLSPEERVLPEPRQADGGRSS